MSVLYAIARPKDDCDRGLKDESHPPRSVQARHHVIHEAVRQQVKFAGAHKLPDRERRCREEHGDYNRRENGAAGD